jgi:hypothetical protein
MDTDYYVVPKRIIPQITTLLANAPRVSNGLWKRQDSKLYNILLDDIKVGKRHNYRHGRRLYSIQKIDKDFFRIAYNSDIPMESKIELILIKELMGRSNVV